MVYYSKCDDKIRKLDVKFDAEKLENIKQEIIKNCSLITHFEYDATVFPENNNIRNVENLFFEHIGNRDNSNSPDRNVYHFSFDEYKFPYLVRLINELQNGNSDALYEIINPNYEMEEKIFGCKIEELNNEKINNLIWEIDNNSFDNSIKLVKLNQLNELIKQKELNKNRMPICFYYIKVRSLIKLTKIDEYDYDLFKQNCEFIKNTNSKNIERVLKIR
ncbi:MAG: hypothetical protein E7172_06320 [Firmicutes bacterium]|nr:hypothetical protein [Bacillota bacterium]